jgi:hypothetical protein
MIQNYFSNERTCKCTKCRQYNSFIIKLKKKMLAEAHKKIWAGQHPELLWETSRIDKLKGKWIYPSRT